jgi:hypothetical protein
MGAKMMSVISDGVKATLTLRAAGLENGEARDPRGSPGFEGVAGDGLLSHDLSVVVPSALQGLTAGFGMGPGVAPAR